MRAIKAFCAGVFVLMSLCYSSSQSNAETFTVRDGRPISGALLELARRYGWAVNYVDAPLANADELEDVTRQVAKGRIDHKILVPRDEVLTFNLPANARAAPIEIVRDLVRINNRSRDAELFAVAFTENSIDVVPRAVKNSAGRFESVTQVTSVLEKPVTLAPKRRSASELVNEVCKQASASGRVTVAFGSGPVNLLDQTYVDLGATNEPARLILDRAFANLKSQEERLPIPRLSWHALYAPDLRWYLLNIFPVTPPVAAK